MADSLAAPLEILAGGRGWLVTGAPQGSAALLTSCFENPTEVRVGRQGIRRIPTLNKTANLQKIGHRDLKLPVYTWCEHPSILEFHVDSAMSLPSSTSAWSGGEGKQAPQEQNVQVLHTILGSTGMD